MKKDYDRDKIQMFIYRFTSFNIDIEKIQEIIANFIYFSCTKDLFYLNGDENYLNNEKYKEGFIYNLSNNYTIRVHNNSLEDKTIIEKFLETCKNQENKDRAWLNIIDKTCKNKLNEDFISLILKRTNIVISSFKRPSGFDKLDLKALINILYENDLRKGQYNLETLNKLMFFDNNYIIMTIYDEIKKTIKYLGKNQNQQLILSAIIGLIIAVEKSSKFPQTLVEAYNVFYAEVFSMFSEANGYIMLQTPVFYPIIYFNKMPNEFFKAIPILKTNNEYDIRSKIQNIIENCVNNDDWILENEFDERTLQMLCLFVLTDCFSKYPMKISKQEKFEFAFDLFLMIIKNIPKKTLESSEAFWQNDIIAIFMICCINDNETNRSISANKISNSMKNNTSFELDRKLIKNEVIEKLKISNDLDFIIFIFIIANKIKDKELLDLIENKDEIKSLAFDYNDKLRDLIDKINDNKIKKRLQAIDDYFIYQTNETADNLALILQETYNELGISYNEKLTLAIHNIINSNNKLKYKNIYDEVKGKLNLRSIQINEKERIYELISHGEYFLKDNNITNYAPSINQYCSALERLLNEIVYKPYFSEIQDICLVKNSIRNFTKNEDIKEKYFGTNIIHAMWIKNNKLSLMSLGELSNLMKNILANNERLDIFINATKNIYNNIDIKLFFTYICDGLQKIKPDRDKASHGELMNRNEAEKIKSEVYKNDSNKKFDPSDLILKIDKDLK